MVCCSLVVPLHLWEASCIIMCFYLHVKSHMILYTYLKNFPGCSSSKLDQFAGIRPSSRQIVAVISKLPYLSEVTKHRKLRNKASSDNTFSHISRTTRRTDYLRISAHSAQQDLSGDDHSSMYVMTNQKSPCFVHVNRRAEVQTQMLVREVIACYRVMVSGNIKDTISGS
jgi:hypothetical protein